MAHIQKFPFNDFQLNLSYSLGKKYLGHLFEQNNSNKMAVMHSLMFCYLTWWAV